MSNYIENQSLGLAIIGAGAAGLTAALVASRYGFKTIIFESKTPGGRAGGIPYIESYPGLGKVKGTEFVKILKQQVEAMDYIELHEFEPVKEIRLNNESFSLITDKQEYSTKYLILAMGAEHKPLGAPGEAEFKGRGVSYCAGCDGLFFKDKNTAVIGNDTHAVEQALFLNELGSSVTLITPAMRLSAEPKLCDDLKKTDINVMFNSSIQEIYGERLVGGVRVAGGNDGAVQKTNELEAKGVFISVGLVPRIELVKNLRINLSNDGYVEVNNGYQTNVPCLYAIGDLVSPNLELVSVCASGANAVRTIVKDYKENFSYSCE